MSYEGYSINKYSSCWILLDPDGESIGSAKTKRECLGYLAKMFLENEQSVLAEAYQEKMRERGNGYGYMDALDALIYEASNNSKQFIEILRPELKKGFKALKHDEFVLEIL